MRIFYDIIIDCSLNERFSLLPIAEYRARVTEESVDQTPNGIAIYKIGKGEPILIIPGGPGVSSKLYRGYLAPLSAKWTLIFWDYRGTGKSALPTDGKFSLREIMPI